VVAALDVGGTSIKAALVNRRGRVVEARREPTGAERGPAAVVSGIVELAAELACAPGVRAVGIAVPGTVDPLAGIARLAVNLGWRDVPLVALVSGRTGLPVTLGHDVRTAVLAEARLGAGTGESSMLFIAIGTGIAGGLARNGVVDDGASGRSGEIGHLVVRPLGSQCRCGNRGCLETVASASRISVRYAALTSRCGVPAERIAELVRGGDAAARQVWSESIDALADGLAAATVLIDPSRFVLGGGLSLAGATLVDPLTAALAARLTFRPSPPISLSVLGDLAGVVGAALRAWYQLDAVEADS